MKIRERRTGERVKGTGKIWIFYDSVTQRQTKPMATVQAQLTLLNLKIKNPSRYFLWTPGWTEWIPLQKFLDSDQTVFVLAPSPTMPMPNANANLIDDDKTIRVEQNSDNEITQVLHPEFDMDEPDPLYTEILPSEKPSGPKDRAGYYHEDFSIDKVNPEAKHKVGMKLPKKKGETPNRRSSERHDFKIQVILLGKNGQTFSSHSLNISLGGTLLEDELPKNFINTKFDLIIVNRFEKDTNKGRLHFQGKVVGDYMDPRRLMFVDADHHTLKRLEALLRSYTEQQKQMKKRRSAG